MNSKGSNVIRSNSKEIAEDYISSLSDLTINSKPLINMLTILAEENVEHAPAIVQAVEAHLQKVRSDIKLPVLYLIDSIVKNVNGNYLGLFTQNIVNTFCGVFEKVDENVRSSMWKLRQTWNDVFPSKKLYALDVRVNSIDPAWPISSPPANSMPSNSIHVNPRFLSMQQQANQQKTGVSHQANATPSSKIVVNVPSSEDVMREQLLKKRKELLELERQKIELELLQARATLEQQQRQLDRQVGNLNSMEESSSSNLNTSQELQSEEDKTTASLIINTESNSVTKPAVLDPDDPVTLKDPRIKVSSSENITTCTTKLDLEDVCCETQNMQDIKQQKSLQLNLHLQHKIKETVRSETSDSSLTKNNLSKSELKSESFNKTHNQISNQSQKTNIKAENSKISDKIFSTKKDSQKKDNSHRANDNSRLQLPFTQSTIIQSKNSSSPLTSVMTLTSGTTLKSTSPQNSSLKSSIPNSSTSRKVGNKCRLKDGAISNTSNKIAKLDNSIHCPKVETNLTLPVSLNIQKSQRFLNLPKKCKSRKRTPSPNISYRIPRRSSDKKSNLQEHDEEEQSGALIVSPPHPPTFKEIKSNMRNRNYIRRNKDGSQSPSNKISEKHDLFSEASKDEDLRTSLITASKAINAPLDTKEDLDLRILTGSTGKRQSSEINETLGMKKNKVDKFDALFGNEDVDLRKLTNPKAGRPPTPPPPVISRNEGKDSWAKLKNDRELRSENKFLFDKNRDRLGRPRLNIRISDEFKDRRRGPLRDFDKNERNADRNIEIIMKQAAEQLNQGTITKSQYNKLIQEVLHMSEDQKLRAAQRKEKEYEMLMWENRCNLDIPDRQSNCANEENLRPKDHRMHSRSQNEPRWNQPRHLPWTHPPAFSAIFGQDFRQLNAPWQNHPRVFNSINQDFHHIYNEINSNRLGQLGPNGPVLTNDTLNPINSISQMGIVTTPSNNSIQGDVTKKSSLNFINVDAVSSKAVINEDEKSHTIQHDEKITGLKNNCELPLPDSKLLEEIALDTMKSINIDNIPREIRYYGNVGIVFMQWDDPRDIGFQDGSRRIIIDNKDSITCNFSDEYKEFVLEGTVHRIKLGAPTRELYVDDKWYECYFGGRPITVDLGNKKISIQLEGPPPQVKIGNTKRIDLVLGKINLIINARNMVPVFLDAKPQLFEIDGKQCTLEFIDALKTVLLNGRPFRVEFGGLPKPIIFCGKKHFIRFSVLPRSFKAGYVKIEGMKGEAPKELLNVTNEVEKDNLSSTNFKTSTSSSYLEPDSISQDGCDHTTKPDSQLDVLPLFLFPSMAPPSGLSYQAEPVENPPAVSLNPYELFQRLVETGIVPNLSESKKLEEDEKKESREAPVTFDKPETLKIKQPVIISSLYTGMQCSSCGARFAPELATRYSHHLDWHFRQNRRERDSAKKAHSRPWYYDINDWIQFEEIEDLDDRAQSWFETEKQSAEIENALAEDYQTEIEPSVLASSKPEDSRCQVCHDVFEQFYNEDKEEWHFRPTIAYEKKNYHPFCLEDHKKTLEHSRIIFESKKLAEIENNTNIKKIESSEEEIKIDNTSNRNVKGLAESVDETEQIEIIEVEKPIVVVEELEIDCTTESIHDNLIQQNTTIDFKNIENVKEINKAVNIENDPSAEVPVIFENIKIKQEPIDYDIEPEETIAEPAGVDTTQVAVKSTIDGNVELESTASTLPSAPSKIKINISKTIATSKDLEECREKNIEIDKKENIQVNTQIIPASVKLNLQGRKLANLPIVEKDEDLSALCSIM